jgi:hypothetical protein
MSSGLYRLNEDQIAERGARMARRDDREYREYLREEQRSQPGCPAREVVLDQPIQATSRWSRWVRPEIGLLFRTPGAQRVAVVLNLSSKAWYRRFASSMRGCSIGSCALHSFNNVSFVSNASRSPSGSMGIVGS